MRQTQYQVLVGDFCTMRLSRSLVLRFFRPHETLSTRPLNFNPDDTSGLVKPETMLLQVETKKFPCDE